MSTCYKPVKTVDNYLLPCLCTPGHAGGCNPFSPNPNMAIVIPKADLPKSNRMPLAATPATGIVWTDQSVNPRCLWQGAHGRCIYEFGNHTQHKEEIHAS
jgi:hypothetical protein